MCRMRIPARLQRDSSQRARGAGWEAAQNADHELAGQGVLTPFRSRAGISLDAGLPARPTRKARSGSSRRLLLSLSTAGLGLAAAVHVRGTGEQGAGVKNAHMPIDPRKTHRARGVAFQLLRESAGSRRFSGCISCSEELAS
jgi:hypothetical protein